MTIPAVYLLPVPSLEWATLEPVAYLVQTLEYVAKTLDDVARDPERDEPLCNTAAERRALLYHTAVSSLADTYPEAEQAAVYDRHTVRYPRLNAAQQRVATLTLHGLACDRASGTRQRDAHTWATAATAALETYRRRTLKSA